MYWLIDMSIPVIARKAAIFLVLFSSLNAEAASYEVEQVAGESLQSVGLTPMEVQKKKKPSTYDQEYPQDRDTSPNEDAATRKAVVYKEKLDPFELPEVEVIATTPIGNTSLDTKKVSGNVQSVEDEEIHRHESFAISDFMNRRLENVNINDVQNNPYQPDVSYRGFVASPLAGTPIGLSVYQDGVRVNEPFGDTVNWDLIPQVAIANMELVPGSNPLYGLNTLGGAISVRTKSGSTHQGLHTQYYGGSYGRQNATIEYGGAEGGFDWYMAGTAFRDNGWRPYSSSAVNQVFGKWGWNDDKTDIDLSFTFARNTMNGVGPTPQDSIYENYYAIYTAPDPMTNNLYFWTLKGTHELTDKLKIGGNGYYRNNTTTNLNSNANNNCEGGYAGPSTTQCTGTDYNDKPGTFYQAGFLSSNLIQNGLGINLQLTSDYEILDAENQFVTGGGFNYGHTNYGQGMNNAVFNPVPYMSGVSAYYPTAVVSGSNAYTNLFATDTLSPVSWLHLNASLNWIQAQINTYDNTPEPVPYNEFNYGGNQPPIPGALASSNVYTRVNPSAGFTFQPFDALEIETPFKEFTAYFNYNEGFRAPTAMEQACADPNAPCSLPNVMVSDPALLPVITKTLEVGARSKITEDLKWNAALYQSRSYNDIQYIQDPGSPNVLGYFSNVGITQRMGAEFGVSGISFEKMNWYMSYGFVSATYQSNMSLADPTGENPAGVNVTPGNRLPMIPQNTIKLGSEYELYKGLFVGGDLQYVGTQFARGDYTNQYGALPSYTVLNLNAKYFLTKEFELFVMGRNITNQQYYSFGQMGENFFAGNSATKFLGPGAPATVYGGFRFHWD